MLLENPPPKPTDQLLQVTRHSVDIKNPPLFLTDLLKQQLGTIRDSHEQSLFVTVFFPPRLCFVSDQVHSQKRVFSGGLSRSDQVGFPCLNRDLLDAVTPRFRTDSATPVRSKGSHRGRLSLESLMCRTCRTCLPGEVFANSVVLCLIVILNMS